MEGRGRFVFYITAPEYTRSPVSLEMSLPSRLYMCMFIAFVFDLSELHIGLCTCLLFS